MRPGTELRVKQAIDRLGYTPSRLARQLKVGYAPIIGLIVPSVANPFWGAVALAVEKAAHVRGYRVLLGNSERDRDRELSYANDMWAQGIRAIIFGSSPLSLTHLLGLVERGLHVMAFDWDSRRADGLHVDSVTIDNMQGAKLATNHLIALGHRRIGFISGPIGTASRINRLAGYHTALAEAGISLDPALVWEGKVSSSFGDDEGAELGRTASRELLSSADPPTALLAINDIYALGACAGARDLGAHIPATVSVVGFDDTVLADIVDPPLTTVRQPLPSLTQVAVERLIGRLEKTVSGEAVHHSLMPELVVRGSTAPICKEHPGQPE
jgi:DNA-binding LacI/PurR family transcriptional regulator